MSSDSDLLAICETIRNYYSPCDVCDALLKLRVPSAGFLKDIQPLPTNHNRPSKRLVAPISTVQFVAKSHDPSTAHAGVAAASNLPADRHWTDVAPPGSAVVLQQPAGQIAALVGDIVATRYQVRGVRAVLVDGRARDVVGCERIAANGGPQVWARALSAVGTSLEAKPWAVDVPLTIHDVVVRPGDILVADEAERAACVIPRERLDEVLKLLPVQKEADEGVLADVQGGMDFKAAVARWPKHYTNP